MQIRAIDKHIALIEQNLGNADKLNNKFNMLRKIHRLSKKKKLACQGNYDDSEEEDDYNGFI